MAMPRELGLGAFSRIVALRWRADTRIHLLLATRTENCQSYALPVAILSAMSAVSWFADGAVLD
jgi:hypothetical protein